VPFREDILRGVRLFAIAFAAILLCVAGYRVLRSPADVQSAAPEAVQAAPEPETAPAPVARTTNEVHPLTVPPPPPVGGVVARSARPRNTPVPAPPPLHASRAAAPPAAKEFESSELLPAPPPEEVEASAVPSVKGVGYKSLLEANPNKPPAIQASTPTPPDEDLEKSAKGNRFFRAIGKIFRSDKKDPAPLPIQPKQ
jgi:hypothetical protein